MQNLKIIHSYVSERKQFVEVDRKNSSVKLNNFGMPQGTILGSALCNLYIIDLEEKATCDSLQYADNTTLYKHSKPRNLKNCIKELESDLEKISLWSSNNSLVFNDDKAKLMLFSTTHLSQKTQSEQKRII